MRGLSDIQGQVSFPILLLLTYSPGPLTNHFGKMIMLRCMLEKRTMVMEMKKNRGGGRKEKTEKRSREKTK